MFCTIWLPDDKGSQLHCAAAPSLTGFSAQVGPMVIGPKGASCGTAVYRREPVYVTDIQRDPLWDDYRDSMSPYGIRSVWSRPLFTNEGRTLGTFAILYREPRGPLTQVCWRRLACRGKATFICVVPQLSYKTCAEVWKTGGVLGENVHTEVFGALDGITPGMMPTAHSPHPPHGPEGTGPTVAFTRSGITTKWDRRFGS